MCSTNKSLSANHHTIWYLLMKSMELQDQIVRAEKRTIRLFETLAEDLKIEIKDYEE